MEAIALMTEEASKGGLGRFFGAVPLVRHLMAVAFVCLLLFTAATSWAEITYHVSVDGSDDYAGTERQPFNSVSRAQLAIHCCVRQSRTCASTAGPTATATCIRTPNPCEACALTVRWLCRCR